MPLYYSTAYALKDLASKSFFTAISKPLIFPIFEYKICLTLSFATSSNKPCSINNLQIFTDNVCVIWALPIDLQDTPIKFFIYECYYNLLLLPGKKSSMHLEAKFITLKLGLKYFCLMNILLLLAYLNFSLIKGVH